MDAKMRFWASAVFGAEAFAAADLLWHTHWLLGTIGTLVAFVWFKLAKP